MRISFEMTPGKSKFSVRRRDQLAIAALVEAIDPIVAQLETVQFNIYGQQSLTATLPLDHFSQIIPDVRHLPGSLFKVEVDWLANRGPANTTRVFVNNRGGGLGGNPAVRTQNLIASPSAAFLRDQIIATICLALVNQGTKVTAGT